MRIFWLNFIAVLIALASFQVHDLKASAYSSGYDSEVISSVHAWDLDPLKQVDSKSSYKKHYIAQDFIPIVTIATMVVSVNSFIHYYPVYNLTREKNYFLLI